MEQQKNSQTAPQTSPDAAQTTSPEQGRQPGNAQQTSGEQSNDISHVDQQEGQMNHGETGGNFSPADTGGA